jgi:hypothetical protein
VRRGLRASARRRAMQFVVWGTFGGPAIAFFGVITGRSLAWAVIVLIASVATVALGIFLYTRSSKHPLD